MKYTVAILLLIGAITIEESEAVDLQHFQSHYEQVFGSGPGKKHHKHHKGKKGKHHHKKKDKKDSTETSSPTENQSGSSTNSTTNSTATEEV